jgi:hypothetical protein
MGKASQKGGATFRVLRNVQVAAAATPAARIMIATRQV